MSLTLCSEAFLPPSAPTIDASSLLAKESCALPSLPPGFLAKVYKEIAPYSPHDKQLFFQLGFLKDSQTSYDQLFQNPPQWIQKTVAKELKKWSSSTFSGVDIQKSFEKLNTTGYAYAKITLKDQKAHCTFPKKALNHSQILRGNTFTQYLNQLLKVQKLPDCSFLLLIEDGYTQSTKVYPSVPVLAFTKPEDNEDFVLVPDGHSLRLLNQPGYSSYNWKNDYYQIKHLKQSFPFEKTIDKAFWRGRLTDFTHKGYHANNFKEFPRGKLLDLSRRHPLLIDAKTTCASDPYLKLYLEEREMLDPRYFTKEEQLAYRYHLVADGVSCTYPGFHWRLLSQGVVLKQQSSQKQWFYAMFKPHVHYIPVKKDFSDLAKKVLYLQKNPEIAKKMALKSSEQAERVLGFEPIAQYLYHFLKQYARHMQR